jgi:hypothetical protein
MANDRSDLSSEGAPVINKTILVNVNRNKYPVVRPSWVLKPGLTDRPVVGRKVTLTLTLTWLVLPRTSYLYGCETASHSPSAEHRLRVSEDMGPRKISGPKRVRRFLYQLNNYQILKGTKLHGVIMNLKDNISSNGNKDGPWMFGREKYISWLVLEFSWRIQEPLSHDNRF